MIDGYLIMRTPLRARSHEWVCLEDIRFHHNAARMLFDLRPEMLDARMKTHIAELIRQLGHKEHNTRIAAQKELETLMDLPGEQLKIAAEENKTPEIRAAANKLLKKCQEWKDLRKYLEKFNCRRDPIYFTTLIRHTADLEIQKKAIERLKKITGEGFGLKPSKHWIEDQKEASDKYDEWWFKNRKELKWSEKEDRYLTAENEEEE